MVRNTIHGTRPRIIHNCGSVALRYGSDFVLSLLKTEGRRTLDPHAQTLNSSLAIMSWSNYTIETLIEKECAAFGYTVAMTCQSVIPWSFLAKISRLHDFLVHSRAPYVLALDCMDVLFARALTGIIRDFEEFNCDMLFNAEQVNYPPRLSTTWFEIQHSHPPFAFLNAGAIMCRREPAIALVKKAMDMVLPVRYTDDQSRYKQLYESYYPAVRIDSRCKIFQAVNGGEIADYLEIEK